MSGFTVPIQERDSVDVQNTPSVGMNVPIVKPIPDDVGSGLYKVANALGEHQQTIENKQRILTIHSFENQADAIKDEANNRVIQAKGENVFPEADQTQKEMRTKMGKLIESSPEQYRADITNVVNQRMVEHDKVSQGHQYRETNVLTNEIQKTNADNLTNKIAAPYLKLEDVDNYLEKLKQVTTEYSQHNLGGQIGVSSDQVKQAVDLQVQAAQSLAIRKKIEVLASMNDVTNAKAVKDRYNDILTASDTSKVNKILSKGDADQKMTTALRLVDDSANYSEDPTERRQYIQNEFESGKIDGVTYNHALAALTSRTNFEQKQQNEADHMQLGAAIKDIYNNRGQITEDTFQKTPQRFWPELQKQAFYASTGKNVPLDPIKYSELETKLLNADKETLKSAEFSNANIIPAFPPNIANRLIKMRDDFYNDKSSVKDVADLTKQFIKTAQSNYGTSTKYKDMVAAQVQVLSSRVYEDVKASLPAHSPTSEIRKIYQQDMALALTPKKDTSGFFGMHLPFHDPDITENFDTESYKAKLGTRTPVAIPDLPADTDQATKIKYQLQKNGQDASPEVVDNLLKKIKIRDAEKAGRFNQGTNNQSSGDTEIDKAFNFTAPQEGFNPKGDGAFPYMDGGKQTIGYGHHLLPGEKFDYPISESQARQIAFADLHKFRAGVESRLAVPVSPEIKTALIDVAFNSGGSSPDLKYAIDELNAGREQNAINRISNMTHDHYSGLENPGLVRRSKKRAELVKNPKVL